MGVSSGHAIVNFEIALRYHKAQLDYCGWAFDIPIRSKKGRPAGTALCS